MADLGQNDLSQRSFFKDQISYAFSLNLNKLKLLIQTVLKDLLEFSLKPWYIENQKSCTTLFWLFFMIKGIILGGGINSNIKSLTLQQIKQCG